jgi:hypothetical protein
MADTANKLPLTLPNVLNAEPGIKYPIVYGVWSMLMMDQEMTPGVSYFDATNFYKVGKSIAPDRRLRQVYPKMPFETEMVGYARTDCMSLLEKSWHWVLSCHRVNGEWFSLEGNTLNYAKSRLTSQDPYNLCNLIGERMVVHQISSTYGELDHALSFFSLNGECGFMSMVYALASEISSIDHMIGTLWSAKAEMTGGAL